MKIGGGARIGILLLSQFSFAELGQVLDPLFISNWLLEDQRFKWQLLAVDEPRVQAANGIPVAVDGSISDNHGFDIIFVLASFETKVFVDNKQLRNWLRQAARDGTILCGIEGGTEALAAAGLLKGYRVAIHWDNFDGFQESYPDVQACLDLYTVEARRLSCAGGSAVVDLMFHWLRPQLGKAIFSQLQNHMLEPRARPGSLMQGPYATEGDDDVHPVVRRAVELMRASIDEPVRITEIATRLRVSARQLERHFRRELQVSPSKHYLHMRIIRAHRLLQQTDMSIAEVAASAGFQSLEHFSRTYRQYYGCPPSQDRLQTTQAPSIPRER